MEDRYKKYLKVPLIKSMLIYMKLRVRMQTVKFEFVHCAKKKKNVHKNGPSLTFIVYSQIMNYILAVPVAVSCGYDT